MSLINFKSIFDLVKNRINFTDADAIIDDVVKNGINQAYLEISKNDSPVIATSVLTAVNGVVALPDNCLDIIKITEDIDTYLLQGSSLITSYTGAMTITYSTYLTVLTSDNDIPLVQQKYWYLMSTYGCYAYYLYKKKEAEATFYLNEYNFGLEKLKTKVDQTQGKGGHYYSKLLGKMSPGSNSISEPNYDIVDGGVF